MAIKSPLVLRSLVGFLSNQISNKEIKYLIPLESKGALLTDLALRQFPPEHIQPEVLYLRSIEYLSSQIRSNAIFGIFDDFVFSGYTIKRALDEMLNLGIPRKHIHIMAFFKFEPPSEKEEACNEVLADTLVPGDGELLRLSQEEILRDVQKLAVENKIPASYDNLDWDITISEDKYSLFMRDLAKTGWFLHYGRRGKVEASALLVRTASNKSFSSLPKIRFWYDKSKHLLRITPISFAKVTGGSFATLEELLTPEHATERQSTFASYQAQSLSEQVALLGYLKPYFIKFSLTPQLNKKHINRYFGPRSTQVATHLNNVYQNTPELAISRPGKIKGQLVDFYWIAAKIMRKLAKAYWTQPIPRVNSKGFSVSNFIDQFAGIASPEAVHAAIDYCADMNFIATFFDWESSVPYRVFRLTENGEMQVGRNDGIHSNKLIFIEKLGSLILSKSENHEAYWWVLEKIPAIIMRRWFELPQLEAAKDYFGDITKLHPREKYKYMMTWPKFETFMWQIIEKPAARPGINAKIFTLSSSHFEKYRNDILDDPEIVKVIGPVETLLELTKSKTMGHHVAILIDILSDYASGATYLANSINKALELIEYRCDLSSKDERQNTSREIKNWLKGLDEKIKLLVGKRKKLLEHMEVTVARLNRQNRGDLAAQLMQLVPFPENNKIMPAFAALSLLVKRLNQAVINQDSGEINKIAREVVFQSTITPLRDNGVAFTKTVLAIKRWAAALSGIPQDDDVYNEARLSVDEGKVYRLYIVAYDLIGSSNAKYTGRIGANRDRHIQSIISNWFIAFGGYAQRFEFGGGDLGYGFFHSATSAVQASLWASYHLELLKITNPLLKQEKPHAGFGIVLDELHSGFDKQVRSDWLSKFAKAWKREAERIADNTGRHGQPVVAIHSDMFAGCLELPKSWFGTEGTLDGIPVRFIKPEAIYPLPWE